MLTPWGSFSLLINSKANLSYSSLVSFSIASFHFFGLGRGSDSFIISTGDCIFSCSFYTKNACMLSISLFISPLLSIVSIGNTDEMLNGFTFMSSVTDIIFFLTLVKMIFSSHTLECSLNTLTRSPGSIRYLVARGSLDFNSLVIHDSTTIGSISASANISTFNI